MVDRVPNQKKVKTDIPVLAVMQGCLQWSGEGQEALQAEELVCSVSSESILSCKH